MKRHIKLYLAFVLAQAACLALGLWLEHRFVLAVGPRADQAGQDVSELAANKPAEGGSAEDSSVASRRATKREMPETGIRVLAFTWITALQAAVAYLVLTRTQDQNLREKTRTARVSLQRYNDLLRTRDAVIFGLAKLAESRDSDTGNHLDRIAIYSTRLATALRRNPRYRRQLTPAFVKLIGLSSALHDIGKVGIKDAILLKPGELEAHEHLEMEMHAVIGGKCIREIESQLGRSNFLQMAREIAFCHHERWDGRGYPKGLAGEEIPSRPASWPWPTSMTRWPRGEFTKRPIRTGRAWRRSGRRRENSSIPRSWTRSWRWKRSFAVLPSVAETRAKWNTEATTCPRERRRFPRRGNTGR